MKKTVATILNQERFNLRGVFISTYIPRHCGIATYTKDLTNAINVLNPNSLTEIMAMDDSREKVKYPWEVKFRINRDEEKDYLEAANYINKSSCDYVSLQHEFGIFGGRSGEYILSLVRSIKKPLVTTFHTTLKKPNQEQLYIIKKLAGYSSACVVMISEAAKRLKKTYMVPEEKIVILPHGVPNIPFSPADMFKQNIKQNEKTFLIGSINLIAPNKGLENIIMALPKIKKIYPEVKFMMIGETHPLVKINTDEQYRKSLLSLVNKLKLQDNFVEINRYLPLDILLTYLKALDVYITPYLDLSQTSSGTLAYALGAGKICISTPYIYAKETLSNGRGIFVETSNSDQIADKVIDIIKNKNKREQIEKKAYDYGRHMIWERVALDYLNLFEFVTKK